jgi:spore coat polysaccharide biosynthesis protein SpsF
MNTVAIIQARSGSKRLPDKVMMNIGQKKLFEIIYERVRLSKKLNKVVFATTNLQRDDKFCSLLEDQDIPYFRGDEKDVLNRYYEAAKHFRADIIVRITCDDPFKDPALIDACLLQMIDSDVEFCSNIITPSYPIGLDVECLTFNLLKKANRLAKTQYDREHVTAIIYKNLESIRYRSIRQEVDQSSISLTLDTFEDLKRCEEIYERANHNYRIGFDDLKEFIT